MRIPSLLLTALLATSALSSPVLAAEAPAAAASTLSTEDASSYANRIGNETLAILTDSSLDAKAVKQKLETLFSKEVDLDGISKFVMGRSWRSLSDAQQKEYQKIYGQFLIEHYTSNFVEFTQGTTFKVGRVTAQPRNEQKVAMDILRPGKPPVKCEYRLSNSTGTTKIVDIAIEGVSLTTTQRQEFASVMQRQGYDYLISQLQSRIANEKQKVENAAVNR
jgi:phospholipid transport system substrate-binding protein